MSGENLEKNSFYHKLVVSDPEGCHPPTFVLTIVYFLCQTQYQKWFSRAADNCGLICVPQNKSMNGIVTDQKLISCHVLKPSPLLKK